MKRNLFPRVSALFALFPILLLAGFAGAAEPGEAGSAGAQEQKAPVGLGGVELEELESDYQPEARRLIIPPFYQEKKGKLKLHLFFPLYVYRERTGKGARKDLGVFPIYWYSRSSEPGSVDVIFPLYWRYRGPHFKTDVVLQTYFNRSDWGYNFGLAPLVFVGKDGRKKSSYQVVPPLFWHFTKDKSSFLLAGIYYQHRKGDDYDLGFPPLFFAGRERYKSYVVVLPPVFWHFGNALDYSTQNVVPPFFFNTREHGWSFGAMPILYVARDRDWDKTMVLPFYYGARWQETDKRGKRLGEGRSHYFPVLLSYYRHGPGFSQGGAAVFYHWYWDQGEYWKMFTPLVWLFGHERTGDKAVLIPPLFYRRTTPVSDDTMAGLIYWNFHDHHKERTFAIMPLFAYNWNLYETHWRAWVLPTLDFGKHPGGYHAWIHPLFYVGKDRQKEHLVLTPILWRFKSEEYNDLVVAPIYWRFDNLAHDKTKTVVFPFWWQFDNRRKQKFNRVAFPLYWDFNRVQAGKRTTVVPPFYWQQKDENGTMTGVLNVVWHKGEVKGNRFWTFQFLPLIGFGHPPAPEGAYWSFLGGLAGWRRQGSSKQLKLFWIPINIKAR